MIDDGYTETSEFNDMLFEYRPIIGPVRAKLFRQMRDNIHASMIAEDALWDAIIDYDTMFSHDDVKPLLRIVAHVDQQEQDRLDAKNLVSGVWLELSNPKLAIRDCEHCKIWWYDEQTGNINQRAGRKLQRPQGTALPCETENGCQKGTPQDSKALSVKNRRTYEHYRRCRRLGFPDDPIVLWHADLIEAVEEKFRMHTWMKNCRT